ncbi:MAG: DNA repair protein RecN, partial [Myxococcota bacterium]
MLSHIRIKDFAIIDDVDIQFGDCFTVITGETGAGKSILIQAITLLLGSRGDTDFIRNKSEELLVEGIFQIDDKELLIRRTLNRSGRSKIYINDELATLNQLKDATAFMVDISGQHQHQMLLNEESHIDIVDKYASNSEIIEKYKKIRDEYFLLLSEIKRLNELKLEKDSRLDYLKYQREELSSVAVSREEYENLINESSVLRHSSKFQQILSETESIIYSQDANIVGLIGKVRKRLLELSSISRDFECYIKEFENFESLLSELNKMISDRLTRTDFSSDRLDTVEGKLHRIKRVCEKYRISVEEIIPRLKKIDEEIYQLENSEIISKDTEKRLESVFESLKKTAEELHKIRVHSSKDISTRCEEVLERLGFKGSRIKFEIEFNPPADIFDSSKVLEKGFDIVRILFAPNIGEEFKPLFKIASGGELSRVMLAFKSAISGSDVVRTYIFDEVDAGIGGAVAESVGRFLKELSQKRQVICITHLPQIASLASDHFTVEKFVENRRTSIRIRRIKGEERVEEIARMMGGHKITEKNRAYA